LLEVGFLTALQRGTSRNVAKTESQELDMADSCQAIFALNEFIYVD